MTVPGPFIVNDNEAEMRASDFFSQFGDILARSFFRQRKKVTSDLRRYLFGHVNTVYVDLEPTAAASSIQHAPVMLGPQVG